MRKDRVLLVLIIVTGLLVPIVYAADSATFTYKLMYTFENRGNTEFTLEQEDYTFPLFINNTWQTVYVLNSSHGYSKDAIDVDGNIGAIMNIDETLSPGEMLSFSIEYQIESTSQDKPSFSLDEAGGFNDIPSGLAGYTSHTESFPRDDPEITATATKASKGDEKVLGAVANLIDYVKNNTTYCNFETPRYPLDTLGDGLGDCDDQSILLISMCRSLEIPAYLKVGIIIHPNIVDSDTSWDDHLANDADGLGWHGWAMVYIPPYGWTPVDLTLIQEDSGLEYIMNAPEYDVNIIEALDASNQAYIGNTIAARERIIDSDMYITVTDEADQVYSSGLRHETYLLLGLGAALAGAIFMMFQASGKDQ